MNAPPILDTSIEYLKGVGPVRADLLKKELGIFRFKDLLFYFPFRYVDRSKFYSISEITSTAIQVQFVATLISAKEIGAGRGKRLVARVEDESGEMELVWFQGHKWIKPLLKAGKKYLIFGKPSNYKGKMNFNHPEIELLEETKKVVKNPLQPVYSTTEKLATRGLNSRGIGKIISNLLETVKGEIKEVLSSELINKHRLIPREQAIYAIHHPPSDQLLEKARFRLKFEELIFIQLTLLIQKVATANKSKGVVFEKVGEIFNSFYQNQLPFELTGAQKRVMKEIRRDIGSGRQMNRLLQGDVGSGKTVVALLAILIALDNGFQACLMAPTEILATQHFETLLELLGEDSLVTVQLLTGSSKTAKRREIHEGLENGALKILVGTHALLEEKVKFQNLGIAIIDEQHRFGVAQRAKLWKKNVIPPHILIMTATPIPRTLAMTLYGDLDVSVIDELPPGRKPIKTQHYFDSKRNLVFKFIEDEIAKGRQVYVVYPLIEESEKLDYKDLMDGYESIARRFPLPNYNISIVHGRMKAEEKNAEMERFASGKSQIMVATTVIEVGVNVPNASIMIVESAQKFGLSQLHQLRGRVGRGAEQSYCILMTDYKLSADGKTRVETMVRTNDGFEIAEVDLKLRGPGDLMGTQQSGVLNLTIADLTKDQQILMLARQEAIQLLEKDSTLKSTDNQPIRTHLSKMMKKKMAWSKIS